LKKKVVDISHNMSLLMAALERNLGPFREAGGYDSNIGSEGKPGGNENPENKTTKELEKEQ
jgi:hypothetical protein